MAQNVPEGTGFVLKMIKNDSTGTQKLKNDCARFHAQWIGTHRYGPSVCTK